MKKVLAAIPEEWKKENNLRCYVSFIKEPVTTKDVMKEVQLKEGVDSVKVSDGVIFMSTKISGLTKSSFTKLIGKKIYQDITMRNFNTTQKLLALMGEYDKDQYDKVNES